MAKYTVYSLFKETEKRQRFDTKINPSLTVRVEKGKWICFNEYILYPTNEWGFVEEENDLAFRNSDGIFQLGVKQQ